MPRVVFNPCSESLERTGSRTNPWHPDACLFLTKDKPAMLERIVTGGQSGVDQAAWRAAKIAGLPTGGWMPLGFLTEEGERPEFAAEFSAQARGSDEYAERTVANVAQSDAVLVIAGSHRGVGTHLTINTAHALGKPCRIVPPDRLESDEDVRETVEWLRARDVRLLQVAGERASVAPYLGPRAEAFLLRVFRQYRASAVG